jgi:hypothetical protein
MKHGSPDTIITRCLIAIFLLTACLVKAQMPETDIWLFELDIKKNSTIKKATNITQRKGYDNQPSFSSGNKSIYYTSHQDGKQTDIYEYNISSRKTKRLTFTEESEYSPTEVSGLKNISVVTVLKDSSQVLQYLAPKTYSVFNAFVAGIDSVGYYTHLNTDTLLYYVLTQPHSLRMITSQGKYEHVLAEHPTRCFKSISRNAFIYGVKDSVKTVFYVFDFRLKSARKFAEHEGINEDIFWHADKGLYISNGLQIKHFSEKENTWQTIYDLSAYGLKKVSRFCFSANGRYLAVVDHNE